MDAINWEAVGALSEGFGAVAVVASLIFVGFQVRHNTRTNRTASVNSIMSAWCDMYVRFSENENYANMIWQGTQDPNRLAGSDRWRLSLVFFAFFQLCHNAFYQSQSLVFGTVIQVHDYRPRCYLWRLFHHDADRPGGNVDIPL